MSNLSNCACDCGCGCGCAEKGDKLEGNLTDLNIYTGWRKTIRGRESWVEVYSNRGDEKTVMTFDEHGLLKHTKFFSKRLIEKWVENTKTST